MNVCRYVFRYVLKQTVNCATVTCPVHILLQISFVITTLLAIVVAFVHITLTPLWPDSDDMSTMSFHALIFASLSHFHLQVYLSQFYLWQLRCPADNLPEAFLFLLFGAYSDNRQQVCHSHWSLLFAFRSVVNFREFFLLIVIQSGIIKSRTSYSFSLLHVNDVIRLLRLALLSCQFLKMSSEI